MSDFQDYIDLATQAGYNVMDEDGVSEAMTAYHCEETKQYLVIVENNDDGSFFVQTFDYDSEEYDEPIFESDNYKSCVDFCMGFCKK